MKNIRDLFTDLFNPGASTLINEESSLHEIAVHYPQVYDFLERKYGVKTDAGDRTVSLKEFVVKHGLPPSQVVFMEVQMDVRAEKIHEISVQEAKKFLEENPQTPVLDVREDWEVKIGKIPNSQVLNPQLLDQILNDWEKDTPIIIYCHHGVRSMDAATFFADRGFTKISTLLGGIDSWSANVDPSVPRYQGNYC